MKLSDILKTSCKSFSMKFLEINSFTKKLFTVFRQESWTKFYERVFLWTKEKDSVQFLKKSNTVHLKYTTLLSLQQQSQDLNLLLLQGLDCLTFLRLYLLILYNELIMLSFPSFPFIVLFLQVFWSKFASYSGNSRRKTANS